MSEHVYCVAVTFKMTEQVEQSICIKFCPVGSSGTASPITQAGYSRVLFIWAEYTFLLYLRLDCCWKVNGRDLPRLVVSYKAGCDH